MKKILIVVLTLILSLCTLACGGNKTSSPANKSSAVSEQKSQLKNQDLNKIIPIAKLLTANETELREIEKILSALGIDFNNIKEWKDIHNTSGSMDSLQSELLIKGHFNEIMFTLTPGKGNRFNTRERMNDETKRIHLIFDDKKLVFVTGEGMYHSSDRIIYYSDGKIQCRVSDFIISNDVSEKITKKAIEIIKKSELAKNVSDLKLDTSNFWVQTYSPNKRSKENKLKDSSRWEGKFSIYAKEDRPSSFEEYITGYANLTGKEKYFGGENDVYISIRNLRYDLNGNLVNTDMFEEICDIRFKDKLIEYHYNPDKPNQSTSIPTPPATPTKDVSDHDTIIELVEVKHSSADSEDQYTHSGTLTVDGDTKTCWSEGVPGLGINENITYRFNKKSKINGLNIWIGHQKTEDLFYKNARPTAIRIIGSDGSNEVYTLQDTMGMQKVTFNRPITTWSIELVVEKVAPGSKYEDTCIAEVSFF